MQLAEYLAARPPKRSATITSEIEETTECATVGDKKYNAIEAYIRVLELEPERYPAWNNVALVLMGREGPRSKKTIEVKGLKYNCLGCFVRAIELNPTFAFMWVNVAACIPKDASADFKITIGEKEYTKGELMDEAIRLERAAHEEEDLRLERENPHMGTPV
jgi:hypothetical protein